MVKQMTKKVIIGILVLVVVVGGLIGVAALEKNKVKDPNYQKINIEQYTIKEGRPTIVYFTGYQCPWCLGIEDTVDEIAKNNPNVDLIKIDRMKIQDDLVKSSSEAVQKLGLENWGKILDIYGDDLSTVYRFEGREQPKNADQRADTYVPLLLSYDSNGRLIAGIGNNIFKADSADKAKELVGLLSDGTLKEEDFKEKMKEYINPSLESILIDGMISNK